MNTANSSTVNQAFGGNLNPALNTPQGQMATSQAAAISQADQTFLFYTTQTDPAYAEGRMQDAIGRIYFLERLPALPTTVSCTCTGLAGVIIPAGAQAIATDGNLYVCAEDGVIGAGGTVTLDFNCVAVGPIPCPADTLTTIYQAIPGWDSINNPADGVLGQNVESRSAFEARRAASVALNSRGALPSILGAVLSTAGVIDAYVSENPTGSPVTVAGVSLAAHSLYVAAVGGTDLDVATAIWTKKSPGCAYNGNTTVTVTDSAGYNPPYPTYSVTFERPTSLPILVSVNILNSPQVPSNATALIQAAVIAAFAGADGGPRARIGSKLLASRFYAPIAALGSWAQILSIQLGSSNTPSATFTAAIATSTLNVSAVASGSIAIGQTVVGAGVADGTVITAGSSMTWTVTNSQVVSSETMYGVLANQNEVTINGNQAPTISAANISVTLT